MLGVLYQHKLSVRKKAVEFKFVLICDVKRYSELVEILTVNLKNYFFTSAAASISLRCVASINATVKVAYKKIHFFFTSDKKFHNNFSYLEKLIELFLQNHPYKIKLLN